MPTTTCTVDTVYGKGKYLKMDLFSRLKPTFKAYHRAMKVSVTTWGALWAPTTLDTALLGTNAGWQVAQCSDRTHGAVTEARARRHGHGESGGTRCSGPPARRFHAARCASPYVTHTALRTHVSSGSSSFFSSAALHSVGLRSCSGWHHWGLIRGAPRPRPPIRGT